MLLFFYPRRSSRKLDGGIRYTFTALRGSQLCFSWYLIFFCMCNFFCDKFLYPLLACIFLVLEFSFLTCAYVIIIGEQIRILACLSAYKQDTEIITPFKVAAVMNKTGIGKNSRMQNGNIEGEAIPVPETTVTNSGDQDNQLVKRDSSRDVSTGESLLRMEDHKRQTEQLLRRFENSHYFVRIAESNEPLWSKRVVGESYSESPSASEEQLAVDFSETAITTKKKNPVSASIDRGKFDSRTSGGLARGAAKCCSLSNGDIVVCFT